MPVKSIAHETELKVV